MPASLRRTLLCLLVAALAFLAHAPLFGSGFVGGDLDLLASAAGRPEPGASAGVGPGAEPGAWLARGAVRPIPAAILRQHAQLHEGLSPLEPAVAAPYFALALVVLLLAAGGAGVTLRRVLVPWLGESAARAAGWACAGLVVAHPASVAVVARPAALGDLLALAAGAWCTAFLLRGRQQRRARFLAIAAVLALVAGFASSAAWLLPFACACLEFASAHRPRAFPRKLAAAAAVALCAALAVGVETACAWPQGFGFRAGTPYAAFAAAGPDAWGGTFDPVAALGALGVLFVPAPSPGAAGAWLACGVILLLAAEPVLRAVRAAPRLWGWIVLGWMATAGAALVLTRDLQVPPGRVELGSALLVPGTLVCAGLATAATALGGSRRTLIPLAIAALLCILSDRTARIWPQRSRELLALRGDLDRGLAAGGNDGVVYVVGAPTAGDPRAPVLEADRHAFGAPEELDLIAGAWPPPRRLPDRSTGRVRRVLPGDLPYLARAPSGVDLRRRGLAVLLLDRGERPAFRLPPPDGEPKPFAWRGDGRSDLVELDPLGLTMVRVTPRAGISTAEPPRMRWRATNAAFENGTIEGAWVATDDGPRAVFDLWRSNEWLLGGTIRRVWFEKELLKIVTAEVLPRVPLEGLRVSDSGRFEFDLPEAQIPRAWSGEPEWWSIVILGDADHVTRRAGELRRDGSFALSFDSGLRDGGPPCGMVECRVGGVTVARTQPVGWPAR